ncbi:MAG: ATP-binding cassette domain-containing protein [Synergistaceae bacterium]|jgi:peptide/nickel transport system ATP-binding protein|nr:ATP-binding cassette domain-containing protein [Synergistaceae bacterium]
MTESILETRGLKKYFQTHGGALHAVDGVNVSIGTGRTLGVVGESGCGKSTLGRVIMRILEPTGGEVLYKGQDIMKLGQRDMKSYRAKMQMIFQDPYSSLNPRMSVSDIIADPIRVLGRITDRRKIESRVFELMDTVGLARRYVNSYPHELDGGRRQRVGIARALSLDPEFIVCDEPVSALDVSIQAQILNLMMDLQEENHLTYMFITHDLSVVRHISTEIMVMYLGQCVERAPARELFEKPTHPYTELLLDAIPIPSADSRYKKRRLARGEVTNLIDPEPGCRFAGRCPYGDDSCAAEDPILTELYQGHFVACVKRGVS